MTLELLDPIASLQDDDEDEIVAEDEELETEILADELFAINDEEDVSTGSTTLELLDPIASLQDDDEDEKVAEDEYGAASEEEPINSELEYCEFSIGVETGSSPQPCERIASETHAKPKTRLFSKFILYTQPFMDPIMLRIPGRHRLKHCHSGAS